MQSINDKILLIKVSGLQEASFFRILLNRQ